MKFLISALLLLSLNAFATDKMTECYTSTSCAHITFNEVVKTKMDAKFKLNFDQANIDNVKVILWMTMPNGHGHGSAPTKLKKISENEYLVENVWFVMKGHWDIKVQFSDELSTQEIIFPLEIIN